MSLSGWACTCGRKGILVEGGITFYQEACHSGRSSILVGEDFDVGGLLFVAFIG